MRKLSLILLVGLLGIGAFGCAMTDFCNTDDQAKDLFVEQLMAQSALGCQTGIAQDNAQRPVDHCPGGLDANGVCIGGFVPLTSQTQVDLQSSQTDYMGTDTPRPGNFPCHYNGTFFAAGDPTLPTTANIEAWTRNLAAHAFIAEAQVFSPASQAGYFYMGSPKALFTHCDPATGLIEPIPGQEGSPPAGGAGSGPAEAPEPRERPEKRPQVRINTWGVLVGGPTHFSCTANAVHGLDGETETGMLGEGSVIPPGRTPGLQIMATAVDSLNGVQFGRNVRAWDKGFDATGQTGGFSLFLGLLGRAGEGRHEAVQAYSSGLADFVNGEPLTITLPGTPATFTSTGTIRPDGMLDLRVEEVTWGESVFTPSEPFALGMSRDFRKWEWDGEQTGVYEFYEWWLATVPDEPIYLEGIVPELGHVFDPPLAIDVVHEALAAQLSTLNRGGSRTVLRDELRTRGGF